METAYDCLYLDEVDKEESRDKEDALLYLRRRANEQHQRAHGQGLNWAEFDTLGKYGVLIGLTKLDPEAPGGLKKRLLDPGTTFPTFSGDDLRFVTRSYETDVGAVMGVFPDPDDKIDRMLLRATGNQGEKREYHNRVKIYEYIDNWYHAAYVDDEELFVVEHGFNRVPVIVQYLPYGDQMFTITPTPMMKEGTSTQDDFLANGYGTERQLERCRKALPFLFHQFRTQDLKEAIAGVYVTMLKWMRDPAWIHKQDVTNAEINPLDTVSRKPGKVTAIGIDEAIEPVPVEIQPQIAQIVAAFVGENDAMMGLPRSMAGTMPGSQTTGTALDILKESGAENFWPVVDAMAQYRARDAQLNLELIRDWEPMMGEWGSKGAGITIPRKGAAGMRLTREMLQRTGTEVDVRLNQSRLPRSEE